MPTSDDMAVRASESLAVEPPANERFWAFISYSHRDARAAARLQRDIESYRLPPRVVGRQTSCGVVPARLRPVFRDRSDLPAGADLRQTIRDALKSSRWLIVVCSPEAVESEWVEREIEEFARQHGTQRILAAIVRGEPYASSTHGRAAEECLPAAYRIAIRAGGREEQVLAEPAGVDLRKSGDGARIAAIKLIAGMTGLDVDDLLHRDLQRRVQLLAGFATASIAAALLLAAIAVEAYRARDEARRQRANAEQLVAFMLGDLQGKLLPVGRLDLLDAVANRALKHYASQRAETLSPEELTHRARAYHLLGGIQEQRGSLANARAAFARGAETTAQLLRLAPNDAGSVFEHAQSMFWVGYLAWLERRMPDAETAFLEYLRLARRLHALDPNNLDSQLEIAYATQNLGNVMLGMARAQEAHRYFLQARDIIQPAAELRPDLRLELNNTYGWIAVSERELGRYAQALQTQQRKLRLLPDARTQPEDRRIDELRASALSEIARLHALRGKPRTAETTIAQAIALYDALIAVDPSNTSWRASGAVARLELADQLVMQGQFDRARIILSETKRDVDQIARLDVERTGRRIEIVGRWLLVSLACDADPSSTVEQAEAYATSVERAVSSGSQLDGDQRRVVAEVGLKLGDAAARNGDADPARSRWRAALRLLDPLLTHEDGEAQVIAARLALRINATDLAVRLRERLRRQAYRHGKLRVLDQELRNSRRDTLRPLAQRTRAVSAFRS